MVRVGGEDIFRAGGYCGYGRGMSNNLAEYTAFYTVLTETLKYPGNILIRGDSQLVICHLSLDAANAIGYRKKWKVNGGAYMPFHLKAKPLYEANQDRVTLRWIPREQNDVCDVLSKQVLKDRNVKFRIQPE